ncbi:MAG: hypothetical protein RIT28_4184, partial [Pseudomonadota bacterium]
PVVNSRRQLWSVAGAISFIVGEVFGLSLADDGISLSPFVPSALRTAWFGDETTILLNNLPYRGRRLHLSLYLPAEETTGPLVLGSVRVNGVSLDGALITEALLPDGSDVQITLTEDRRAPATVATISGAEAAAAYTAPQPPTILGVADEGAGGLTVTWDERGESGVTATIFRDGAIVAEGISGGAWLDVGVERASTSPCYAVMSVWASTGLASHHSAPVCYWGEGGGRVQTVSAYALGAEGGVWSEDHGRAHIGDFGDPGDVLTAYGVTPGWTGAHLLQLVASAGGPLNTGVCAGLKRVSVIREGDGAVLAEGPVLMAQSGAWDAWRDSSFLPVALDAAEPVRVGSKTWSRCRPWRIISATPGAQAAGTRPVTTSTSRR